MEIITYNPSFKMACIAAFESNLPKFFATDELRLFENYLERVAHSSYFLVIENEKLLACGGIYFDKRSDIGALAWGMVHATYHRQGIGRSLFNYRIAQLQEKYPNKVCQIETSQHSATFYQKMGFVVKEIVPNGFAVGIDKYMMDLYPVL